MTALEIIELQAALARALEANGASPDTRLTVLASAVVGMVGEMHVTRKQAEATRDHVDAEKRVLHDRLTRIEAGVLDDEHKRAVEAAVSLAAATVRICEWLERRAQDIRRLVVWVGPFVALLTFSPSLRDQIGQWLAETWAVLWRHK